MASVATAPLLSVEQYLQTTFQPDMDYVDGVLEARHVGEFDHGDVQWALLEAINAYTPSLGVRARPEVRVQVSPTRFRVPDVCVVSANWKRTQIVSEPPLLCVEVLSPGDRLSDAIRRCNDYLTMGVPEAWVVEPTLRSVFVVTLSGSQQHRSGVVLLPASDAPIDVERLFTVLDQ